MGNLRNFFKEIYGEYITGKILTHNANLVQLETKEQIIKVMKTYIKRSENGCSHCKKLGYKPQQQDFPGWVGAIKYNIKGNIANKDILVFGLEVASMQKLNKEFKKYYPGVKDSCIHIAYDFGYEVKISELVKRHLFKYLNAFLDLESIKDRLYVTDVAKCFTDSKKKSRLECFKLNFKNELSPFKDGGLVLIFQGGKIKRGFFSKYFNFTKETSLDSYIRSKEEIFSLFGFSAKKEKKNLIFEMGSFKPTEDSEINKSGKYFQIPHSSQFNWSKLDKILELIVSGELKELPTIIRKYII